MVEESAAGAGARCATEEVRAEELARAKRRHRMLLEFSQDSPGELAGWFGGTELFRAPETFSRARGPGGRADARRGCARWRGATSTAENLIVVAVGQRKGLKALERVVEAAEGLPSVGAEPVSARRVG